jgi:proteasome lid subunit RPN8/RPN11
VRAGVRPSLVPDPAQDLRLHRCVNENETGTDCQVILSQTAYQQIMDHLKADTTREHGGLLLGQISKSEISTPATIWITHSLPAQHTLGTPTSLTLTEETWLRLAQDTDELERCNVKLQRLGWYHSHPGIAIFLSHWDLDVCTNFNSPHHVALVVDPIKGRGGFFPRGEQGYQPHEPRGFWEFPDLKSHSVIEWKNTYEVPREFIIPAHAILPFEEIEEPDESEEHERVGEPEDIKEAEDTVVLITEAEQVSSSEDPDGESTAEAIVEVSSTREPTEPDIDKPSVISKSDGWFRPSVSKGFRRLFSIRTWRSIQRRNAIQPQKVEVPVSTNAVTKAESDGSAHTDTQKGQDTH